MELQKQETSTVALSPSLTNELTKSAEAKDLILPKILLMQGLSKLVAEGKGIMGEIRESLDGKLLAPKEKTLELIPMHFFKTWLIFRNTGKLEYVETVPYTPANADWKWEEEIGGIKYKRVCAINIYCVLPDEIKEGIFIPYVISFRSKSFVTGKKFLSLREKMLMGKRMFHTKTFKLGGKFEKNDLGSFYVFDVSLGRDTTKEEIEAITPWFGMLHTAKVDDSEFKDIEEDNEEETIAI